MMEYFARFLRFHEHKCDYGSQIKINGIPIILEELLFFLVIKLIVIQVSVQNKIQMKIQTKKVIKTWIVFETMIT